MEGVNASPVVPNEVLVALTGPIQEPSEGMVGFVMLRQGGALRLQQGGLVENVAKQYGYVEIPEMAELLPLASGGFSRADVQSAQQFLTTLLQENGWVVQKGYSGFSRNGTGHRPQEQTLLLVQNTEGQLMEPPPRAEPYPLNYGMLTKVSDILPAASKRFDESQERARQLIEKMTHSRQKTAIPGVHIVDGDRYEADADQWLGFVAAVQHITMDANHRISPFIEVGAPDRAAYVLLPPDRLLQAGVEAFQNGAEGPQRTTLRRVMEKRLMQLFRSTGIDRITAFSNDHAAMVKLNGKEVEVQGKYVAQYVLQVEKDKLVVLPPGIYPLEDLKAMHDGKKPLPSEFKSVEDTQWFYSMQFFDKKKFGAHAGSQWIKEYADPKHFVVFPGEDRIGAFGEYVVNTQVWPGQSGPTGISRYLQERFGAVIDFNEKTMLYLGEDSRAVGMLIGTNHRHIQQLSQLCGWRPEELQLEAPNIGEPSKAHASVFV